MKLDTTARSGNGNGDFSPLETDVYLMEIKASTIEEDKFDLEKDGSGKLKLVLRWEVYEATEEQDEDCKGLAVWQRLNPVYCTVKEGGDSKFKAFIDSLVNQGMLENFDPADFDSDCLVGIRQRVSVEQYRKTMGANAGKPGNKVVSVLPLRRAKAKERPGQVSKTATIPTRQTDEEPELVL